MIYCDYEWNLSAKGIELDSEIDIDKLGWTAGDHFKLVNINGKVMLKKVHPLVAFVKGYKIGEENGLSKNTS
jgi:hypothetical protein